jgi:hypothetical protein
LVKVEVNVHEVPSCTQLPDMLVPSSDALQLAPSAEVKVNPEPVGETRNVLPSEQLAVQLASSVQLNGAGHVPPSFT